MGSGISGGGRKSAKHIYYYKCVIYYYNNIPPPAETCCGCRPDGLLISSFSVGGACLFAPNGLAGFDVVAMLLLTGLPNGLEDENGNGWASMASRSTSEPFSPKNLSSIRLP